MTRAHLIGELYDWAARGPWVVERRGKLWAAVLADIVVYFFANKRSATLCCGALNLARKAET